MTNISLRAVNHALRDGDILYESPKKKKPFLNQDDAIVRLHFAKKYQNKPIEFWRKVIFTDET